MSKSHIKFIPSPSLVDKFRKACPSQPEDDSRGSCYLGLIIAFLIIAILVSLVISGFSLITIIFIVALIISIICIRKDAKTYDKFIKENPIVDNTTNCIIELFDDYARFITESAYRDYDIARETMDYVKITRAREMKYKDLILCMYDKDRQAIRIKAKVICTDYRTDSMETDRPSNEEIMDIYLADVYENKDLLISELNERYRNDLL